MRIAHVITRLIVGGAQENTLVTVVGLMGRGHDVTLITGPTTGPEGSLVEQAKAAGVALADVVHAHVELVPVLPSVGPGVVAAEDLHVAAGHVVPFEHEHPLARRAQAGRGGQPAGPGSDDDRIPLFGAHGSPFGLAALSCWRGGRRPGGPRRP